MTTGRELSANLSVMLGMNNRRPDFRLRVPTGVFAHSAANVDFTDSGSFKRRQGYAQVLNAADAHSFWVDQIDDVAYYADGSTLYRATPSGAGLSHASLSSSLSHGRALTYARVDSEVMFSDGVVNRTIASDGTVRPLGAAPLGAVPNISASAGGALRTGVYQLTFAFSNDSLEISPATQPVQVSVPANGVITISGLPASWPADAATLHVYVTPPNGDGFYLERKLTAPVTSITLVVVKSAGMQVSTLGRIATPPGRILRFYAGRLFSAHANQLWFSDPYMPHLCTATKGYVQFNEDISIVEVNDGGMYVVAEGVYWLAGDISNTEAKLVSPTRGVFGTGGFHRALQQCFWMSPRGFVVTDNAGNVSLPQEENIAISPAAAGASLFRDADGQRQLISALTSAPGASAAARSYMDAEVIRKSTVLHVLRAETIRDDVAVGSYME